MDSKPDLVVGIDVGTSCTGVAYLSQPKSSPDPSKVRVIERWDGKTGQGEHKVPTMLSYDKSDVEKGPTSWGFLSKERAEQRSTKLVCQWFKQEFGESLPEHRRSGSSTLHGDEDGVPHMNADTLYRHFLTKLYEYIRKHLSETIFSRATALTWDTASIEFLFTVPATWDLPLVAHFHKIASQTGFGKHTIGQSWSMSEPQAVAVFTAYDKDRIGQKGDSILIIDVGGGTADLCLVKIEDRENDRISLTEKLPIQGDDIGSTYIDSAFQELALKKLQAAGLDRLESKDKTLHLPRLAWEMMMSDGFQDSKHRFGVNEGRDEHGAFVVHIPTDNLETILSENKGTITESGDMRFLWRELRDIFDEQCDKLKNLIDERMIGEMPLHGVFKIDHVIFSGGLGGSPYIKSRLREQYGAGTALQDAAFHTSQSPQLSVCKGIVMNRVEKINPGPLTFSKYCSPMSIGVLKQEKYSWTKPAHRQAKKDGKVVKEAQNGKAFVQYVDWFIRKCEKYDPESIIFKESHMKFAADTEDAQLHGRITVVGSRADPDKKKQRDPPKYRTDWEKLGEVLYNFSKMDNEVLHERHGHWYSRMVGQKPYRQVNFFISAKLGPGEANIECWSAREKGKSLSVYNPIPMPTTRVEVPAAAPLSFS